MPVLKAPVPVLTPDKSVTKHGDLLDIGKNTHPAIDLALSRMKYDINIIQHLAGIGAAVHVFEVEGRLAVTPNAASAFLVTNELENVVVYIYCKTPGTAGTTIVDVNQNGTTMFTDQNFRPHLIFDNSLGWAKAVPAITTLSEGDIITIDIDQRATAVYDLIIVLATSDVEVEMGQTIPGGTDIGITTGNLAWGPLNLPATTIHPDTWILRSAGEPILRSRADFPCTIQPGSTITMPGTWTGDAADRYKVWGQRNGIAAFEASVTNNPTDNVATFSQTEEVDGFFLELNTDPEYIPVPYSVAAVASGTVGTRDAVGTSVATTPGNLYAIAGDSWNNPGASPVSTDNYELVGATYIQDQNLRALLPVNCRVYEATAASHEVRVYDPGGVYSDNTPHPGLVDWDLYLMEANTRTITLVSPSVLENIEVLP